MNGPAVIEAEIAEEEQWKILRSGGSGGLHWNSICQTEQRCQQELTCDCMHKVKSAKIPARVYCGKAHEVSQRLIEELLEIDGCWERAGFCLFF